MYQTHWGLEKPPFPSGLDARLFYEGASQRQSLARLRFLLAHRRRLGLVLGETGLGKSLLLSVFAEQCRLAGQAVAKVDLLGISSREFFWQLGNELHAAVRVEDDMLRLYRQLTDRLHENSLQGKQTVLVLDDLDQVGPDVLNQVQRLLRTETAHGGWLTLVAAANPQQRSRLGKGLLELVDLRIELQPWDELDTIGYLQLAICEAGAAGLCSTTRRCWPYTARQRESPRAVNRLADFALQAGSQISQEIIDASTIQAAHEAVGLPTL